MVILREIQLECHKQIGIERKGGRAIQEEELSPYPQKSDFDGELLQHQNLAQLVESTSAAEDPQISVKRQSRTHRTHQPSRTIAQNKRNRPSAHEDDFPHFFLPCATGTMRNAKSNTNSTAQKRERTIGRTVSSIYQIS